MAKQSRGASTHLPTQHEELWRPGATVKLVPREGTLSQASALPSGSLQHPGVSPCACTYEQLQLGALSITQGNWYLENLV